MTRGPGGVRSKGIGAEEGTGEGEAQGRGVRILIETEDEAGAQTEGGTGKKGSY